MSACRIPSPDAPRLKLVLVGSGEPLQRLEKRLDCAAAGLGLALEFDVRRDHEAFGLAYGDTPALVLDGRPVFSGLPRTETLEAWLRKIIVAMPSAADDDQDSPRNPLPSSVKPAAAPSTSLENKP